MKLERMNSVLGKRILAEIRGSNFAHPGEEKAIELLFKDVPKESQKMILDVGCGIGGTAAMVQNAGYGKVVGADIDEPTIEEAKKIYPNLEFITSSVEDIYNKTSSRFDLFYLLTSFYAFPDHNKALQSLKKVSNNGAEIMIFDYADNGFPGTKKHKFPNPLKTETINEIFNINGWEITFLQDITDFFTESYIYLVDKIQGKKESIISMSDKESYEFVFNSYSNILDDYLNKRLSAVFIKGKIKS